jgi:mannose-6-phosphate isomerase-like protein (cupin superfamily)
MPTALRVAMLVMSTYIVLEGRGALEVEGKRVALTEGHAVFVPAGAEDQFVGYEELSVLVIFERRPFPW